MTEYEYALRTVTVASGHAFEIAHAVGPGTLVALCGTVAVPDPGSQWVDSDPDSRCEVCARLMPPPVPVESQPEPIAEVDDRPSAAERPSAADRLRDAVDRAARTWRGVGRRLQIVVGAAACLVVAMIVILLVIGGGFHADRTSAAYRNGYAYGHDLMGRSDDITGACTQAAVDDPSSTAGKNFIAGCQAGYAARTP